MYTYDEKREKRGEKKEGTLHGEEQVEIDRVTGAELGLLLVLCAQDITDAVEQLKICLTRVRRQTRVYKGKKGS